MISEWLVDYDGRAVAVDGKTLGGSVKSGNNPVHLLAAFLHKEGVVVARQEVETKRID